MCSDGCFKEALPMKCVKDWIMDVTFNKDNHLVIGYAHNYVEVFKLKDKVWELLYTQYTEEKCMLYSMSLYCSNVACGTVFSEVLVWDYTPSSGKLLHRLKGHKGVIFRILWISKNLLASCSDDRTIRLWDLKGESVEIACLFGHSGRVWDFAFIPSHDLLVSVGEDSACILWNLKTKSLLYKLCGAANKDLRRVAYCNGVVATGANDSEIQMFLLDWLLIQNKSLFDKGPQEIGTNGLYCKWQLPVLEKELKQNASEYTKFIDASWESDSKQVIVLCTNKGRIFKIDTQEYSSQLLYEDEKQESVICVRCIPSLKDSVHLLVASLAKGNMAILPRTNLDKTKVKPYFWKAEDTHINSLHLLSNTNSFITCTAEGSLKEWKADYSDLNNIKVQLKESYKTHNKYEIGCLIEYTINKEQYLICGDMIGSLHIFKRGVEEAVFIKRFHKCQRVECLKIYKERLYSIGKDGKLNRYLVLDKPVSLSVVETMNMNEFSLVNDIVFSDKDGHEQIVLFGCKENYGFVWNYTEEYPIFTFACKGGNRALCFSWDEPGCFLLAYSYKTQIMIFNLSAKQLANQHLPKPIPRQLFSPLLGTPFHSKEVLAMNVKHTKTHALIVTGSDDTKVKIFKRKDEVKCVKTISVHRSCAKALKLIKSPIENLYYLVTAGGRTEIHLFELFDELSGIRSNYLTRISFEGENDARIMCIDKYFQNRKEEPLILLLAGTSTGDIIKMEYSLENNRARIIAKAHLEVAILVCKLIFINEEETKALVGTTEGTLYSYLFTNTTTKLLFKKKLHQCGLNGLSIKLINEHQYLVFTGADDQALATSIWDSQRDIIESISKIEEAHDSSIRVVKLLKRKDAFIGFSSGYDQKLIMWQITKKGNITKLQQITHSVPDISAMSTLKGESIEIYLAGDGLEILKLLNYD